MPTRAVTEEAAKGFALRRLRLSPSARGKSEADVVPVVRDVGGLQDGWHLYELYNRIDGFKPEWLDRCLSRRELIEGHVLRTALRIVAADDYARFFQATRSVARKRPARGSYPQQLTEAHRRAHSLFEEGDAYTPSDFARTFSERHPELKSMGRELFYQLYNHGEIVRIGRSRGRPLYGAKEFHFPEVRFEDIQEDDAREWLLLKCLSIYGPFSARDVAHWVGWSVGEAKQTLESLEKKGLIRDVEVQGRKEKQWVRVADEESLEQESALEEPFMRILFNDDALLLGYYRRLESSFGYRWEYPQFSKGQFLQPAILYGTQMIGEMDLRLYAGSTTMEVRSLFIREEFKTPGVISMLYEELIKLAEFAGKELGGQLGV